MPYRISTFAVFSFAIISLIPATVSANEDTDILYKSARNQLGLIMYCVGRGHISAEAVADYHALISKLPDPTNKTDGDLYENEGALGNSYDGATAVSIEVIASGMGITVADRCAQLAALGKQ